MLVVIDYKHQFDFKPKSSFNKPEQVVKDWFVTWNLNGAELDRCFNEDMFYCKTGTTDDIDWAHNKKTIAVFFQSSKKF